MRARKKLNKKKLKTLGKLGIVLALLLGICLLIDAQIRPTVKTMGAYHVKLMATQYMNDAILAQLETSRRWKPTPLWSTRSNRKFSTACCTACATWSRPT